MLRFLESSGVEAKKTDIKNKRMGAKGKKIERRVVVKENSLKEAQHNQTKKVLLTKPWPLVITQLHSSILTFF